MIFDQPTSISMIKIWNYGKNSNRGAKDFAVSTHLFWKKIEYKPCLDNSCLCNMEATKMQISLRVHFDQHRFCLFPRLFNTYEPRHEKTCLWDLQPGKTQTGLRSHRSQIEA